MSNVLYTVYTLLNLVMLAWGIVLHSRTHRTGTLMIAAVAFGLMYDNLILSLGNLIGPGE